MPLTPGDVRNKQFATTRFRPGYDEEEVDAFLDEVEAEIDRLIQENEELRAKLAESLRGKVPAMAAAIVEPKPDRALVRPEPQPEPEPLGMALAMADSATPHQLDLRDLGRVGRRPAETVKAYEDGEVRRIAFSGDELLLFDRGEEGQILNWTTRLRPSDAAALALDLSKYDQDRVVTITFAGKTGEIGVERLNAIIGSDTAVFDRTCDFLRVDYDNASIAFQKMPNQSGPPTRFLGVGADTLSLGLTASLLIQTGTDALVRGSVSLSGYRLLGRLEELMSERTPPRRTGWTETP